MTRSKRKHGYPADWPAIALARKARVFWCCERCNHRHDVDSGHVLTVHHLDGDKGNCEWWNLPALCQRCHLSIQGRIKMEQEFLFPELHSEWFEPYVVGRAAYLRGEVADEDAIHAELHNG